MSESSRMRTEPCCCFRQLRGVIDSFAAVRLPMLSALDARAASKSCGSKSALAFERECELRLINVSCFSRVGNLPARTNSYRHCWSSRHSGRTKTTKLCQLFLQQSNLLLGAGNIRGQLLNTRCEAAQRREGATARCLCEIQKQLSL